MSKEDQDLPIIFLPGEVEKEKSFLENNPDANWEEGLYHIMNNYPQVSHDEIQWLVHGGTALHLLRPDRSTPGDIDIISRDEKMPEVFANLSTITHLYDIKSFSFWMRSRNIPYSLKAENYFYSEYTTVDFHGHLLHVQTPVGIAAGKTLPYFTYTRREKDFEDLKLLGISLEEIQRYMDNLQP